MSRTAEQDVGGRSSDAVRTPGSVYSAPGSRSVQGFTLVELLAVIGVIVILATVLIPSLLAGRSKANDAGAYSVANQVMNGLAAVEAGNARMLSVANCSLTISSKPHYVSYVMSDASVDAAVVNAPDPVAAITCSSSPAAYQVVVTYVGGTAGISPYTLTAKK